MPFHVEGDEWADCVVPGCKFHAYPVKTHGN